MVSEHTKKGKIIICVIYGLARKAAFGSNNSTRKKPAVSEGDVLSVKPAAR
jgi:hypothetical protein